MEKNLFNLQMFADDPASAPGTAGNLDTGNGAAADTGKETDRDAPKYSENDVDKLLSGKFAEWAKKRDKERAKEEEAAKEAARLAQMTEAEKSAERIRVLEEKLAAADRKEAVAAMTKQARAMLQDKNINVGDELLANLIADDAETTKASVESFISLFNAAVDNAVKEALKGNSPKAGSAPTGMTKEQILAIPNRAERQRLMKEHKDLF